MQDFHGFSEPSWDRKSSQDTTRQGKQGKTRLRQGKTRQGKTKARQDCTLVAKNGPGDLFVRPCAEVGGVLPDLKGVTSPGPRTGGAAAGGSHFLRLFRYLAAFLFSVIFSMPFLVDLGSILPPNLPPKIHQNR